MTFTVVYDANVLYPNTLRDLLIRIAQSGAVQPFAPPITQAVTIDHLVYSSGTLLSHRH